ncbi:hypothetical protein M3Y99_01732400 [Aphelenchoides fujianensis]|nr:hypothetical protein M3Y99_01732400 [Aphelenchoides fujianensis]
MRFAITSELIVFSVLVCSFALADSARHRHAARAVKSRSADSARAGAAPKSKRHVEDVALFNPFAEDSSPNKTPNLLKEYLSRGLYQCNIKHLATIEKLNALIKEAYEEYAACQKEVEEHKKTFPKTQFVELDKLLAQWEIEDAEEGDRRGRGAPAATLNPHTTDNENKTRIHLAP